ncbi:DsbA family protein [Pseudomonas sp. NPDC090208]|uniref:DsbA family protein n=1 Tax=Pseudomonas sp. NPDC090208 TaxID=3364478 RepID=UPI00380E39A1
MSRSLCFAFDFLDPWGWIAERRVRLALDQARVDWPVRYQPFRAPLSKTAVGGSYQDYLQRRFGSQTRYHQKQLFDEAAHLGVPLRALHIERTPDPLPAMLALAAATPAQAPVVFDALYAALYRDGTDIADTTALAELLARIGVSEQPPDAALLDRLLTDEQDVARWSRHLLPSLRLGDAVLSGAQPPAILTQWLLRNAQQG